MNIDTTSSPSIRILIADDHVVVRAGLRSLLRRQDDMIVVGEAANASELLSVARDAAPDVVITDLRMPGGGVLDCIRSLCGERRPRVVVFTAFDDPTDASLALHAG